MKEILKSILLVVLGLLISYFIFSNSTSVSKLVRNLNDSIELKTKRYHLYEDSIKVLKSQTTLLEEEYKRKNNNLKFLEIKLDSLKKELDNNLKIDSLKKEHEEISNNTSSYTYDESLKYFTNYLETCSKSNK